MVNKLITTKFYDSPLLFTHCSCICKTSKQICEHCWFLSTFLFHDTSLFCADNVHFASSAQLVRALQDAEIQYRFQVCERNQHFTFLSYDVVQLKLYICTKYKIVWNMRNEWRHIWVYVYTRIFCRCTRIWTTISWAVVAIFIVYSLTFCSTIAGRTVTSKLSSHVRNVSSTRTCSCMEFPTALMN